MARGGRADWRRCERGPEPAALIGQSLSAEPRSPASRWGKLGRDREEPELRARIPQVGAWQVGARTLEQGPGGKDLAPGSVRRALPRELRRNPSALPQGVKTGHLLTETEPSSSRDAGPPPPARKERVSHLPESKIVSFSLQKWAFPSWPPALEIGFLFLLYPLEWNVPPQSGFQPPQVSRAP